MIDFRLLNLIREKCYQYSDKPFKLASGKESNEFIRLKNISLHPGYRIRLAQEMARWCADYEGLIEPWANSPVMGVPQGGVPLAITLQDVLYTEYGVTQATILFRDVPKVQGLLDDYQETQRSRFEGLQASHKRILLIEDVATTGGSAMKLIVILRQAGVEEFTVFSVVNREEGVDELFMKEGIRFYYLTTLKEVRELNNE